MSTIIRKAVPDDVLAIVELGEEAININPYEGLVPCPIKMMSMAVECVSSANNFAMVVECDGEIVGAVCALVHPMMFYKKSQASVLQFYCKKIGYGVKLLRELMNWVESRPVIKMVCFTLENKADPRIGRLLRRLGLNEELPVYMKIM